MMGNFMVLPPLSQYVREMSIVISSVKCVREFVTNCCLIVLSVKQAVFEMYTYYCVLVKVYDLIIKSCITSEKSSPFSSPLFRLYNLACS